MAKRESFVFYGSWFEAISHLQRDIQGEVLTAIIEYGLKGVTTDNLKPIAKAMLTMIIPQIEANNQRYENGKKGGRPPRNETSEKPNDNQTITKPKANVYVNDNVYVNNNPKGYDRFSFKFIEDDFKDSFLAWIDYKREIKDAYKSQKSLEACYKQLKAKSNNNPVMAMQIVEQSMGNNWKGLFELKEKKGGINEKSTQEARSATGFTVVG